MDLVLLSSIALRLATLGLAVRLWRRLGDHRIALLAAMALLMALRQVLTGARAGPPSLAVMRLEELPGLVVSVLFLLAVLGVEHALDRDRQLLRRVQKSEARYRRLVEHASDGVLVVHLDGAVLEANRRMAEMLGYAREALLRASLFDLIAPESIAEHPIRREELERGETILSERVWVRKDGTRLIAEAHVTLLPDGTALSIVRDVTEARAAQRELERTAAQLADAQRLAQLGSWRWEIGADIAIWSDELYDIFGIERGTPADLSVFINLIHPDDRPAIDRTVQEAVATGIPYTFQPRIVRPDGSERVVRASGQPVLGPAGEVQVLYGIVVDITEQVRAAAEIERNHALLHAVSEGTTDAVFVKDLDGRYQLINTGGATHLGRPVAEILGKTDEELFSQELAGRVRANDQRAIESDRPMMFEEAGELGDDRTYLVTRGLWRDEQGNTLGVVGIARDITDRKRAEEALRASEAFLRVSQQIGQVGSWEWDPDDKAAKWSDEMYRIHGTTPGQHDPATDPYGAFVHPQDLQRVRRVMEELASGGQPRGIEYRVVRPNGDVRDVFGTTAYRTDAVTGHKTILGTVQDMTDTRRVERQLRETAERLELTLEAARMGYWDWDILSSEMSWSPGVETIYGLEAGGFDGRYETYLKLVHPDDRSGIEAAVTGVLEDRTKEYEVALRIVHSNGETRWVGEKGRVFRDAAGTPIRMIGTAADITDRKRAEEALREREELFRSVFDQAVVGIVLVDVDTGVFRKANAAFCDMIGYTETELQSLDVPHVTHPEDREASRRLLIEVGRGDRDHVETEKRYVRKDGSTVWGRLSISLVANVAGAPHHLLAIISDVTERRKAEVATRESEARFRSLVEHASEAIVILDVERGRFIDVNPVAERLFGMPHGRLLETGPGEMSPPMQPDGKPSRDGARGYIEEALAGGTPTFYWVHRSAAGADIPCEVRLLRLPGTRPLIRGAIVDVTERLAAEEALRKEKAQFETLFESAPEAIALVDNDGIVLRVNAEFQRLFGFTPRMILGRALDDLLVPDDLVEEGAAATRRVSGGERVSLETQRRAADGRLIEVSVLGSPISDERGQVAVLAIYRDISARKEAERALRESQQHLEAAQARARLGSWEYDARTRTGTWSREMYRLYGRDPALGPPSDEEFLDLIHPDDVARVIASQQRALQGHSEPVDFRTNPANGPLRFLNATVHVVDGQGDSARLAGTVLDITDRKQIEEALRASETRFRALIEHSFDVITMFAEDGTVAYSSPSITRTLGYDPDELIGRPGHEIVHPDDLEASQQAFAKALAEPGSVIHASHRIRHKDGSYRRVQIVGRNLLHNPHVRALVSNLRDVTTEEEVQSALRESEEKYRTLFESSPVGIGVADLEGNLLAFNEAMLEPGGYHRADIEALGNVAMLYHDARDRDRVLALFRRWGYVRSLEVRFRRKDGAPYDGLLSLTPATIEGQPCVLATVQNISERKRAEQAVRESREELRQFARRLQEGREEERTLMAREIHDELGQSLTGLKLDLSWLVSKFPRNWHRVRERAAQTLVSVDGAIDTVRDLATRLRPAILDDLGLVAAIEWQANDMMPRAGIPYDLNLDPEADRLDRERSTAVFRIFQETCTNIIRHANASRVTVSLRVTGRRVEMEVLDDGRGISRSATMNPQSLGIVGMRERARSFGGSFTIGHGDDGGTRITVSVPLEVEEAGA